MTGQFLAVLTGLGYAGSTVFFRQAVFRTKESTTSVFISIFFGTVIFSLVLVVSGKAHQLTTASWQAIAALVGAGIIVFILGRWLNYQSLKLIGANRGGPLLSASAIVSVIFGIAFMNETVTWGLCLGVGFIVVGVVLVSSESGSTGVSDIVTTKGNMIKGVAAGLSAGISYGFGPFLVKVAIEEGNSPYMGLFVSYAAAFLLILIIWLLLHKFRESIVFYRKAIIPMSVGSTSISMAQLCMYLALYYIPVSVAGPISQTYNLFLIALSFIINRKIELFTWKIIAGAILVVSGVFLIFQV
jgi:drug/metabolite transporter (DMT)-like permease